MAERYILALDQGTSSSRALLFDRNGKALHQAQRTLASHFPQPGWVEQDPTDLWQSQLKAARQVLQEAGVSGAQTAAIGLTNQRETTLIWDRHSGEPIAPAIVWQCRRSAALVEDLYAHGYEADIRQRTGLVLDAYFSATKIRWLLDHVPGARQRANRGHLAFGTVDTWLLYQLSGGRLHCTDASNASRTMLYNIHACQWDEDILNAPRHPGKPVARGGGIPAVISAPRRRRAWTAPRRYPSEASSAISRALSSGRHVSPLAWSRIPTEPGPSC